MFCFLKRPEDVKNEFVAVERGKSPTSNPDYMQRLFGLFCFQGNFTCMVIIGKREGWNFTCFLGL